MFEKRFFLFNNLGIAIMMVSSFVAVIIPLDNSTKAEIIGFLIMSYALGRTYLWNKLEKLEAQWKSTLIDPITQKEVLLD